MFAFHAFFFRSAFQCFLVGLVHCSRDPQTSFFNKNFIKNESHDTIYIFKNYFTIVFSIFSKINDIQTDSINNIPLTALLLGSPQTS